MTRRLVMTAIWLLLFAARTDAQITLPFGNFVPGTVIDSEQVDANNAALAAQALNRTGGTMTGQLTTQALVPAIHDTYDLGTTGTRFQDLFLSGVMTASGNVSVGGLFSVGGFGTHLVSAAGTGGNQISIRNTTAGTTNYSGYLLGNDISAGVGVLTAQSSTYTTTSFNVQDGMTLAHTRPGGMSIAASDAAGAIRFYTGGGTQRWLFSSAGHLLPFADDTYNLGSTTAAVNRVFLADGTATDPSLTFGNEAGIGFYRQGSASIGIGGPSGGRIPFVFGLSTAGSALTVSRQANGTGAGVGNSVVIGDNTSGSGAAGTLGMYSRGGALSYLWVDATGVVRIVSGASPPREDNTVTADTGGTVVGTQTSTRESKDISGAFTDYTSALTTILQTPLWNFTYKSGAYNGQAFVGITTNDSPEFGMDQGRSFNPVTAFGYTVAAFKALHAQLELLQADVDALKARASTTIAFGKAQ
jgi:hypothetical protein